ncbi:hypothetical protein HHK36_021482 [Tetracentron sinense]|uniref:Dynein light chain n=1 Tax=Tetracentron sinense TaxID=13715 RepID=A0A835D7W0_TETSI|nr:hypothetical protein HHK36_021482 [Tetracentron sinense]
MDTHEKQRRGFMAFYNSGFGKGRPESDTTEKTKKPVSRSWGLRKSKSHREMEPTEWGGDVIEGRKSVSHVETNFSSVAAFLQVKVLMSDMPGFMQVHAFRCARRTYDSLEKFSSKHMAYNTKKVTSDDMGSASPQVINLT